jgi:hypothetical protein
VGKLARGGRLNVATTALAPYAHGPRRAQGRLPLAAWSAVGWGGRALGWGGRAARAAGPRVARDAGGARAGQLG